MPPPVVTGDTNVDTCQVQCLNYDVHTQAVTPANRKALTLLCVLPRCPAATECEGPPQRRRKKTQLQYPRSQKAKARLTVVVVRSRRPVVRK